MNQHDTKVWIRMRAILRTMTLCTAAVLVPALLAAAVAPMLLLLIPVVIVASLFLIAALLGGSVAVRHEERRRASWRAPVAPILQASPVAIGARKQPSLASARKHVQRLPDGGLRVPLSNGDRGGPSSIVLASPALIARVFAANGPVDDASHGETVAPNEAHVPGSERVA